MVLCYKPRAINATVCIIDKNCQVSLAIFDVINHCIATDNLIKAQNAVFGHKRQPAIHL